MSICTRRFIVGALIAAVAAAATGARAAYPESTVTLVVGAAPGASGDLMARLIAEHLGARWKKPVVVDNKSGASGMIATNEVRKQKPDGLTIYISNDSAAINEVVKTSKGYEHLDVFTPLSLLALIDFKLVVNPTLPVKTTQDLIAYIKANPGKLNYASSGQFTPHHLMAESFLHMTGTKVVHVPFKGTAPAVMAVMAKQVDFAFSGYSAVDEQIRSGQLRALGSTGAKRNAASPDLPTVGEAVSGYSAGSWWAMWVRKETSAPVREEIASSVRAIIALPDVQARMRKVGLDPVGSDGEALRGFLLEEVAKLRKLPEEVTRE